MTTKEISNGNIDHDSFGIRDLDLSALCGFSDQDFGGADPELNRNASSEPASLAVQVSDESAFGFDGELTPAENSIIRFAERKASRRGAPGSSSKSEKIYITHEDFEQGPQRDAFLLIYGYAENLFVSNDDGKIERAIEFFFCNRITSISFEEAAACIDSFIRTDVLRLRFVYEFWLRKWDRGPLPVDAVELPSRVELMAASSGGMVAMELAHAVWMQPGICIKELFKMMTEGETEARITLVDKALTDMLNAYILSMADKKVYVTGKNPVLEFEDKVNDPTMSTRHQLANIHWSRRW
jgi:hypothetical protein